MKQYSLLLLALFIGLTAFGQNKLELTFSKYKNNENVSYMSFGSNIMDFAKNGKKEWNTKIDRVDIIIFPKDMDFTQTEKSKLESAISEDNYEVLVNAKTKGNKAAIYGLSESDDVLKTLYASIATEEANIYFLLKGNIHFEELAEIGLNFDGAEVFKNIK